MECIFKPTFSEIVKKVYKIKTTSKILKEITSHETIKIIRANLCVRPLTMLNVLKVINFYWEGYIRQNLVEYISYLPLANKSFLEKI